MKLQKYKEGYKKIYISKKDKKLEKNKGGVIMAVSKAVVPCLSYEAGKKLMDDISSTGIKEEVLQRSKAILGRLLMEKRKR